MSNVTAEKSLMGYYHYLFTEIGDPRTNNWFLVTHPVIFPIVGLYLYFVNKLGPKLMHNRPAYDFKILLILYNAFQVFLSVWIFWEALEGAFWDKYSWRCEPVDFSWSPHAMRVARGVYIFYLAKISELLDTVFFVLRKKYNQVTFLHLYHHTVMPLISWGVVKYMPGGHAIFIGFINSFVHIVMYSYYLLAAMGPQFQKYLWWKKHITNLQLLQFCIAFLHSSQLLFYDCGYPKWSMYFTLPNAVFFYYLFANFYKQAYDYNKRREQNAKLQADAKEKMNGVKQNGVNQNGVKPNGVNQNGVKQNGVHNGAHNGVHNGYHNKNQ